MISKLDLGGFVQRSAERRSLAALDQHRLLKRQPIAYGNISDCCSSSGARAITGDPLVSAAASFMLLPISGTSASVLPLCAARSRRTPPSPGLRSPPAAPSRLIHLHVLRCPRSPSCDSPLKPVLAPLLQAHLLVLHRVRQLMRQHRLLLVRLQPSSAGSPSSSCRRRSRRSAPSAGSAETAADRKSRFSRPNFFSTISDRCSRFAPSSSSNFFTR